MHPHVPLIGQGHDAHHYPQHNGEQGGPGLYRAVGEACRPEKGQQRHNGGGDLDQIGPDHAVQGVLLVAEHQPQGEQQHRKHRAGAGQGGVAQLAVLVVGAAQQQGIAKPRRDGQPRQNVHELCVLIRFAAGDQQHPAQRHHQAAGPAGHGEQPALVPQRLAVIRGYVQLLRLGLFDKAVKKQRRRQNCQRHQIVENTSLCQPRLVKGHLILQPAEENAEGPRSADIAGNLQRSFLHNFFSVSITMD